MQGHLHLQGFVCDNSGNRYVEITSLKRVSNTHLSMYQSFPGLCAPHISIGFRELCFFAASFCINMFLFAVPVTM